MTRIFAYARVSTIEQDPENQIREIAAAGFVVEPHRMIAETVSGSQAIAHRKGSALSSRQDGARRCSCRDQAGQAGRDAIDVSTTVAKLETLGIRVHCLALGGVDLTSSAGKLTMGVINAVAQFERDLLIERTQSGLARAKAQGKALGRPSTLSADGGRWSARIADGETVFHRP